MAGHPLKDFDLLLFITVLLLSGIGILVIYSSTQAAPEVGKRLYQRQLVWLSISLAFLVLFLTMPVKAFYAFAYLFYCLSILLLLLPLLRGSGSFPAKRWIAFGALHFQPSEAAKLGTVFALSRAVSSRSLSPSSGKHLAWPILMALLPLALVLIEPDLGTSLVFAVIPLVLFYFKGISILHLFFLLSPVLSVLFAFHWLSWTVFISMLVALFYFFKVPLFQSLAVFLINSGVGAATPLVWGALKEYQRQRLLSFLNPHLDPRGSGWQVIQSKIAIGSGGLLGRGIFQGTQKKLAFLPRQHTDFAFSVIGEELGMLGCVLVLALFFILVWRGMRLVKECKSPFSSLVVVSVVTIFSFHILLNTAMTLGMMPVTGVPLPFISYGGSFLLVSLSMVGLLLNIGKNRYEY